MESGDESVAVAPTPKGSTNAGTDAGTDYGEDEEVEVTASPGTFYSTPIDDSLVFLLSCAEFLLSFFLPQRHLRRRQREEVVGGAQGDEERAREGEARIRLEE